VYFGVFGVVFGVFGRFFKSLFSKENTLIRPKTVIFIRGNLEFSTAKYRFFQYLLGFIRLIWNYIRKIYVKNSDFST